MFVSPKARTALSALLLLALLCSCSAEVSNEASCSPSDDGCLQQPKGEGILAGKASTTGASTEPNHGEPTLMFIKLRPNKERKKEVAEVFAKKLVVRMGRRTVMSSKDIAIQTLDQDTLVMKAQNEHDALLAKDALLREPFVHEVRVGSDVFTREKPGVQVQREALKRAQEMKRQKIEAFMAARDSVQDRIDRTASKAKAHVNRELAAEARKGGQKGSKKQQQQHLEL